jgi:hypothetical protein
MMNVGDPECLRRVTQFARLSQAARVRHQVEHNRDADQPADHMGLNRGKPEGTGQKFDPIRSIRTWGIRIKDI